MNTAAMSISPVRTVPTLERVTGWLLLGFVAALQLSIAAAQVLLGLMLLCWAVVRLQEKAAPAAPTFFVPLLAYGALTLVSSAFSADPRISFIDSKQLVLFAIVPAVYDLARGQRASTVVDVILSVGAASAVLGIVQYDLLHYDNLGQR